MILILRLQSILSWMARIPLFLRVTLYIWWIHYTSPAKVALFSCPSYGRGAHDAITSMHSDAWQFPSPQVLLQVIAEIWQKFVTFHSHMTPSTAMYSVIKSIKPCKLWRLNFLSSASCKHSLFSFQVSGRREIDGGRTQVSFSRRKYFTGGWRVSEYVMDLKDYLRVHLGNRHR